MSDPPTRLSLALHALCAAVYAAGRADESGEALPSMSAPLTAFVDELRAQWQAAQIADALADAPDWLRALTVGERIED